MLFVKINYLKNILYFSFFNSNTNLSLHNKTLSFISFDSYMIQSEELEPGTFRLLEVDNRLQIPVFLNIRFLVTALDVLHS
jgi:hypothetical protein